MDIGKVTAGEIERFDAEKFAQAMEKTAELAKNFGDGLVSAAAELKRSVEEISPLLEGQPNFILEAWVKSYAAMIEEQSTRYQEELK